MCKNTTLIIKEQIISQKKCKRQVFLIKASIIISFRTLSHFFLVPLQRIEECRVADNSKDTSISKYKDNNYAKQEKINLD